MTAILDLDAILNTSADNIETLPDFQNPPAGQYHLAINDAKIDKRKGKDGKEDSLQIVITYKVDETLELSNPSELPVATGTLFTERFQATEDGLKYFKKQALAILNVKDAAGATIRDLLDSIKGSEFKAVIKVRVSTQGDKTYENLSVRPVHAEPAQ